MCIIYPVDCNGPFHAYIVKYIITQCNKAIIMVFSRGRKRKKNPVDLHKNNFKLLF